MSDSAEKKRFARSSDEDPSRLMDTKSPAHLPDDSKTSLPGPAAEPTLKDFAASQGRHDVASSQPNYGESTRTRVAAVPTATAASPTGSQMQLHQYREQLARELGRREASASPLTANPTDKTRVSPIQEEVGSPLQTLVSAPATASTESANTIRGFTPSISAAVRTPSYPFPRMNTPGFVPSYMHRPFTTLSPTTSPQGAHDALYGSFGVQDKMMSDPSTPMSNRTFQPGGSVSHPENVDFPSPNLYDISLMLAAEPGLDAWWNTVVQIMTEVYRAERVTLAVPADPTDIENVPWGQKATYDEHREDDLSLGYMARGSSLILSGTGEMSDRDFTAEPAEQTPQLASRPSLLSRHSFTAYEDNKARQQEKTGDRPSATSKRPSHLSRSKSYLPPNQAGKQSPGAMLPNGQSQLRKANLDEHNAAEPQAIPSWEAPLLQQKEGQGRVLPVLQALDYEADPLIDHGGVARVLERGKVVALTRSYPYLQNPPPDQPKKSGSKGEADASKRRSKKTRPDTRPVKLSSLLGSASSIRSAGTKTAPAERSNYSASMISRLDEEVPRPPTPKYEEYEQIPPSPWSQSPAPSPASRPDPQENPFFTDAMVDEESFNPQNVAQDYTSMKPPEAIGIENSWTVLHIPLKHVLLSKPLHMFKLDVSIMEQKSSAYNKSQAQLTGAGIPVQSPHPEPSSQKKQPPPIAILSILSPIIPYPPNLRQSLEQLAPHLATTFSLCRHYSNLETELAAFQRRRPQTSGFGAIAADGRPMVDPLSIGSFDYMPGEELPGTRSFGGSITSPSDYSGVSRSAAGSPGVTPSWESGGLGALLDKKQSAMSPGQFGADSYFGSAQKSKLSRSETTSGSGSRRRTSKENSPVDKRSSSRLSSGMPTQDLASGSSGETDLTGEGAGKNGDEMFTGAAASRRRTTSKESKESPRDQREEPVAERPHHPLSEALALSTDQSSAGHQQRHTMLHSYGGDFASTFQSLPPSSILVSKPTPASSTASRSGSVSLGPADMPPPSDRLKGLILDSLPAHVFVALPQHGEIVWVNSRFLTYRGQTVADLQTDPWGSIHPDDREDYLKAWGHSLRTGEQFSRTVRIKRFDGQYRWFYARAVASRDKRGVIMQFLGSYMDIHDQHIAELKAARQEEIEASEAKHRLLANLIPQIIFTATEDEGITFANEQWLSYTGQSFEDSLGLGFMDFVHPDDLAKCRIPLDRPPTPLPPRRKSGHNSGSTSGSSQTPSATGLARSSSSPETATLKGIYQSLSRNHSSSSESMYEFPTADLTELARKGVIKVATDSNGRLSYTTEVRLRSKVGEYRWHLIRCVEIANINFGIGSSSYFGSATDINDHKLLEEKLKEAMESKGRFLSNMSHEIRTPLIGISGMVSFLQDTILTEEQRDYTNTIQTSANSLLMIINDILDLSKVDAGMMKLTYEWFHIRALIEDVNELVSTMAIAKRLELNYVVEESVPAWIKGDKVRIRQILLNVIGNAIKFTAEGEVFSRCRVYTGQGHHVEENEIMLEFAIIDTGRGFTKEEAELIFKPFSQIDGSSTRQHGGSGLGLVISKQLVELHGGTMDGKAVLGKGSTFTFTAKFGLPTPEDYPQTLPSSVTSSVAGRQPSETYRMVPTYKPISAARARALSQALFSPVTTSPVTDPEHSSPAVASSSSSDPSVRSGRSPTTERSSVSSANVSFASFSQAARVSGQDLTELKLEMLEEKGSDTPTAYAKEPRATPPEFRPPMYSILVISPQLHSREATMQHIEMTLPKDVPYQITPKATAEEAQSLIGGPDPAIFTHIVINLPSPEQIIGLMDQITKTAKGMSTTILILSDSVQRQAVMKLAVGTKYEKLVSDNQVSFIYKPVKPSRFAVIFDPEKVRDISIDRNRSSAQQMVESQKASYLEIGKRMGNKGYRVLLVEDNPVNQKVLKKYLRKVGVEVDVAADGVECTEMVFSHDHSYWSLILCDLHMPRKDGYQACREIRLWEKKLGFETMPIIALSANVMSDVQEKCVAAGFSDYVTKPVDFIDLSRAMSRFF